MFVAPARSGCAPNAGLTLFSTQIPLLLLRQTPQHPRANNQFIQLDFHFAATTYADRQTCRDVQDACSRQWKGGNGGDMKGFGGVRGDVGRRGSPWGSLLLRGDPD
jgi:hypothetical protein